MRSPLEALLTKQNEFLGLLQSSAVLGCESVKALSRFMAAPEEAKSLDSFVLNRRKEKDLTRQIDDLLCASPVTSLEREDIESLSAALYRIPKTVEKVAERITLAPQFVRGLDVSPQIRMLEEATATVLVMIQDLRKGAPLDQIKTHNEQLQNVEGRADKQVIDLLRELYSKPMEAGKLVFLKDLFEHLERVTDRCRDAGNVIIRIAIKGT